MDLFSAIADAIALGAASALQTTASQAVVDAYHGLKSLLVARYHAHEPVGKAIAHLEIQPHDSERRITVAEHLRHAGEGSIDPQLKQAVHDLLAAVKIHDAGTPRAIGMDIDLLETKVFEVRNVQPPANPGTGVHLHEVRSEKATFDGIGGGTSRHRSQDPKT